MAASTDLNTPPELTGTRAFASLPLANFYLLEETKRAGHERVYIKTLRINGTPQCCISAPTMSEGRLLDYFIGAHPNMVTALRTIIS